MTEEEEVDEEGTREGGVGTEGVRDGDGDGDGDDKVSLMVGTEGLRMGPSELELRMESIVERDR